MAVRYLPLAETMARQVAESVPQASDDLQSAAYMALVEAARSFDPSRGIDFAAYARHHIQGALRDVRREAIQYAACSLLGSLRDAELVHQNKSGSWISSATPAPPVGSELENLEMVREWIRKLPRLQSLAFRHIYLEGKTQEEAAALIGCSAPTLSRLHKDAIATIQYTWGKQ
ncbi:MAG: sigma-70 family RNA polymerase sigma factor [Isosphaeraceae bacterium]